MTYEEENVCSTPRKILDQQRASREAFKELGFVQMRRWIPPFMREDFIAVIEGRAQVIYLDEGTEFNP